MDPEENKIDVDPDYARNNTALRKVIQKERGEKSYLSICFCIVYTYF